MSDSNSQTAPFRSSNGCWTCRLRRKKCDEGRPVCGGCAFLQIDCTYSFDKPEWMDGGPQQHVRAAEIKRQVKQQAPYRRRGDRDRKSVTSVHQEPPSPSTEMHKTPAEPDVGKAYLETLATLSNEDEKPSDLPEQLRSMRPFDQSDSVLFMFHLQHVLPFLFPHYHQSFTEGGKAWILDLVVTSPVFRQAILCQSSYFFALAHGNVDHDRVWENMLTKTRDTFQVLRRAIQYLDSCGMDGHVHGAARVMAAVLQLQRFEIAVMCFDNCYAHLSAALVLFKKLLDTLSADPSLSASSRFGEVVEKLGPSLWVSTAQQTQVFSAEQAAFRFSSALLIFDDIIASTVLQERPRLHDYHLSLLCRTAGKDPTIDLENIIGCQNWVLVQIADIAALDAWKQSRKQAGNLDVMELVQCATKIKETLENEMTSLDIEPRSQYDVSQQNDIFGSRGDEYGAKAPFGSVVTLIWAHASLLYLSLVVSGWQPASPEVRQHVGRALELLSNHLSPPTLLCTVAWPFCLIGCLAEPMHEAQLREMADALRPSTIYGPIRSALKIMESVWHDKAAGNVAELATYFKAHGDLVLLV